VLLELREVTKVVTVQEDAATILHASFHLALEISRLHGCVRLAVRQERRKLLRATRSFGGSLRGSPECSCRLLRRWSRFDQRHEPSLQKLSDPYEESTHTHSE
jgi:hypothetical protein